MQASYIKVPVEMAQFALQEHKTKQVAAYLSSQFLYSGNAHSDDRPVHKVAELADFPVSSVYRYFKWLRNRDWFGKNSHDRYYFRGIGHVHWLEDWQFARAAIMYPRDLTTCQGFMAGVVLASLVQTGKGQRGERVKGRSKHDVGPISLSVLSNTIEVSESTAYKLRKLADKCGYICNEQNLIKITNWTPADLIELKKLGHREIPVKLSDCTARDRVSVNRIRYNNNKLYLQEPNSIKSLLQLNTRNGLSKYIP